jgi:transcriptional regulator with XRE-family HTH domain
MNPLAVFVGERIKARRVELGLSLADVAAKLKIGRQNIHRYEAGVRLPTLEALYPLAAALDCAATDLMPSQAEGVALASGGAQQPDDAPLGDLEGGGQD